LDGNGAEIEHGIGSLRISWNKDMPSCVRLRDTTDISGTADCIVLREQLAYILESHRAECRKLKIDSHGNRIADQYDISRWSLGREVCMTLKTNGFYAPPDPASADVISAVGTALDGLVTPLREYADAVAQDAEVTTKIMGKDGVERWSRSELSEAEVKLIERADNEIRTFDRVSSNTGIVMLAQLKRLRDLANQLLLRARITTTANDGERVTPTASTVAIPTMSGDVVPAPVAPVSVVRNAQTPSGFLARPSDDNIEATALYERLLELIQNKSEFGIGSDMEGNEVIVALTHQDNGTITK
jgi:hypothetical protein